MGIFKIGFKLIIVSIFALFFGRNSAVAREYMFNTIDWERKLSQITVNAIAEDSLHRIWIGTRNGLNCWDGEHMRTYYYSARDTATIIGPDVMDIICLDNDVWTRSKSGLSRINTTTTRISRYSISGCVAFAVYNNSVIASRDNKILSFSNDANVFSESEISIPDGEKISSLHVSAQNDVYIGTSVGGVYKYDGSSVYQLTDVGHLSVDALYFDSQNRLWIGCQDGGLMRFSGDDLEKLDAVNSSVRDIVECKLNHKIFVGSFNGIYEFDMISDKVEHYLYQRGDGRSLPNNSVHDLMVDSNNTLWVGTYFGGLSFVHLEHEQFKLYDRVSQPCLNSNVIGHIIDGGNENLYVATEGGGLNMFSTSEHAFVYPSYVWNGSRWALDGKNIRYLQMHNNDELIISTHGDGLNILNLKTNRLEHVFGTNYTECIIPFNDKYIIATRDKGLQLFDVDKRQLTSYPNDVDMRHLIGDIVVPLYIDKYNVLWLGTENRGLFSYDSTIHKLKQYSFDLECPTSIAGNHITSIFEDYRGQLWIGTGGGGISLYNREDDNFKNINTSNSEINSDMIYAIKESHFGNLWISTSAGLSRFDVNANRFYNYNHESGLPVSELNYNSLHIDTRGIIYAGGVDGLVVFNEADVIRRQTLNTPIVSELRLNNENITPISHPNLLANDISSTSAIKIKSQYNNIEILFSECNYQLTKNKYQYKLDGYDDNWVNAEYCTSARYTNITPGSYTFHVRTADTTYDNFSDSKSLEINVLPPIYFTWYAFLLYALIIFGTTIVIITLYVRGSLSEKKLQMEHIDKKRIEALNKVKTKFFTEISNEYLAPLTIITASIEDIFSSQLISADVRRRLSVVYRNSLMIKKLAGELVDTRSLEHDILKLKRQQGDIIAFINHIYATFNEYAKRKNIKLIFNNKVESLDVYFDPWQLERVLFNTLSIVIDNHQAGASVVLQINVNDKKLTVDISTKDRSSKLLSIEDISNIDSLDSSDISVSLARLIVKKHCGVYLYSDDKRHFNIELPIDIEAQLADSNLSDSDVYIPSEAAVLLLETSDNNIEEHYHLSDEAQSVLIINGDSNISAMLVDLLHKRYNLYFAKSTKEGVKLAISIHPDIILTDFLTQNISGSEVCTILKRNVTTSSIPVVVIATSPDESDRLVSLEAGAVYYVPKLFNPADLKLRINNIVNISGDGKQPKNTSFKDGLSSIDQTFYSKAMQVIEANLSDCDFSVDDFAAAMSLNRGLFYKRFKQVSGCTPNDMILELRLTKAAELLTSNPSCSISELSEQVGFSSAAYFAQNFKQHFGVAPSKYAKQ